MVSAIRHILFYFEDICKQSNFSKEEKKSLSLCSKDQSEWLPL